MLGDIKREVDRVEKKNSGKRTFEYRLETLRNRYLRKTATDRMHYQSDSKEEEQLGKKYFAKVNGTAYNEYGQEAY